MIIKIILSKPIRDLFSATKFKIKELLLLIFIKFAENQNGITITIANSVMDEKIIKNCNFKNFLRLPSTIFTKRIIDLNIYFNLIKFIGNFPINTSIKE